MMSSGEQHGPSGNQPEGGLPDDASPPIESSAASAETPCDPAQPGHEPALSSFRLPRIGFFLLPQNSSPMSRLRPLHRRLTMGNMTHPETVEEPENR